MKKFFATFVSALILFTCLCCPVRAMASQQNEERAFWSRTYFIKNAHSQTYMQVDDNDSGDYSSSGSIMELWDFNGELYQRWFINDLGNGYFSIICERSHLALSVQSDCLDQDRKALVQEAYVGADRQQWRLSLTSRNTYVIRPKSANNYSTDWCMCAGVDFLGITAGLNVEQRAYTNDNNYKDEWILQRCDQSAVQITMGNESSFSSVTINNNITSDFKNNAGIPAVGYTIMNKSQLIYRMESSQIFGLITHGSQTENKLKVYTNAGQYDVLFLSDISALPSSDFVEAQVILLSACYSGKIGGFVDALREKGVEVVIGFNGMIEQNTTCYWTMQFMKHLSNGYSVLTAIQKAHSDLQSYYNGTVYSSQIKYIINGIYTGNSDLSIVPCS